MIEDALRKLAEGAVKCAIHAQRTVVLDCDVELAWRVQLQTPHAPSDMRDAIPRKVALSGKIPKPRSL